MPDKKSMRYLKSIKFFVVTCSDTFYFSDEALTNASNTGSG